MFWRRRGQRQARGAVQSLVSDQKVTSPPSSRLGIEYEIEATAGPQVTVTFIYVRITPPPTPPSARSPLNLDPLTSTYFSQTIRNVQRTGRSDCRVLRAPCDRPIARRLRAQGRVQAIQRV